MGVGSWGPCDTWARLNAKEASADDSSWTVVTDDDPSAPIGAEAHRLAVLERDEHRLAIGLARDALEGPVVEDVAVLVDLDQSRALVGVGPPERLLHVVAVHVVGAGDEAGLGAEGQCHGVERRVEGPERRRLGDLADLARR